MKILVTATSFLIPENEPAKKLLESFADEIIYNHTGRPQTEEEMEAQLPGIDGLVADLDYLTEKALSKADKLKVISRYGVGYDRVDLNAARAKGIDVTNTPGANSVAVCELAFGMMLCLSRHLVFLHNTVNSGGWGKSRGVELNGKTLGIVGLGAIGKQLAIRAKAFGMDVQAYDVFFPEAFAAEHGIRRITLEELLKTSDFVSLHVPSTPETHHMINAQTIAQMKKGAIVINTARGGIVDEHAAADALKSGQLGGIGLDAFEVEPLTNSPLKDLPNVLFTPHTGSDTGSAMANMGMGSVRNLIDVLSGKGCKFIVNP